MTKVRQVLEEFRLQKVLKTSAQCTVFQATDPRNGSTVVLKLINPATPVASEASKARFEQFATSLEQHAVSDIPKMLDHGLTPDQGAFLVVEPVEGETLESFGDPSIARRMSLLLEVLGAVEALAAAGVTHGNLAPDNILVSSSDTADQVRLLGLGTAAYLLGVRPEVWPQASTARDFLAPEVAGGRCDLRSDLYSLTKVACDLLGLRIVDSGGASPRVEVTDEHGDALGEPEFLCKVLTTGLTRDPAARTLVANDLRDALIRAMPMDPSLVVPGAAMSPADDDVGVWDKTTRLEIPKELLGGAKSAAADAGSSEVATQSAPSSGREIADLDAAPVDRTIRLDTTSLKDLDQYRGPSSETGVDHGSAAADGTVQMSQADLADAAAEQQRSSADDGTVQMPVPIVEEGTVQMVMPPPVPAGSMAAPDPVQSAPTPAPPSVPPSAPPSAPPMPPPIKPSVLPEALPAAEPPGATPLQSPEPAPPPRAGKAPKTPKAPRPPGKPVPWKPILGAVGAIVVLGVIAVLVKFMGGREANVEVLPTPLPTATAVARPTPQPSELPPAIDPALEIAQERLTEGDLEGARAAVAEVTPDMVEAFSNPEREIWSELQGAFDGADIGTSVQELREGLKLGSIRMIRRAVGNLSSVSDEELDADANLGSDIERARHILRLHSQMWKASDEGDRLTVLETAAELVRALPEYSGAPAKREEAAQAMTAEAERYIADRDFSAAVRVLEALRSRWPSRVGVADRIEWCRRQMESEDEFRQLLAKARQAGSGGDPEAGLKMLEGVEAPASLRGELAAVRGQLQTAFDALDSEYPVIEIPKTLELAFRKDRALTIPIRITDDYRVERAVVLVRTATRRDYQEIPLRSTGDGVYPFEVGPKIHGNEDVEFYVVATDVSGHETRLGGPDGPLKVERKKWYQR